MSLFKSFVLYAMASGSCGSNETATPSLCAFSLATNHIPSQRVVDSESACEVDLQVFDSSFERYVLVKGPREIFFVGFGFADGFAHLEPFDGAARHQFGVW